MATSLGAFELELAIEPSQLPPKVKISTLELSGSNLFIGTDEGSLIHFELNDRRGSELSVTKRRIKELGPKSPITFIRAASALDRLLVLCDATLYVINASDLSPLTLSGSPKFKGVTACCVNENPNTDDPFSVQVCLGKGRQLAVISINEQRMSVYKIKEMSASVQLVCMDGNFVCAALESHYIVYNFASGVCQDLFPIDPESSPFMIRVAREEFLLSAPGGLGMFVTSAGMSERPPIQWTKPVFKFVFCRPYIIALTEARDNVVVYSILDQKPKQTLQFFGGCTIGNFDGHLVVASSNTVYRIKPISVQLQIEYLLENERVEEALELAENATSESSSDPGLESALARARVRSAFISLKRFDLVHARDLLVRGHADPREVICLFPRLLPASSNFTRSARALNDIADVNQIAKSDVSKLEALDLFLIEYLEYVRTSEGEHYIYKHDLDTALIKLYSKKNPSKLLTFIRNDDILCDVDDCLRHLEKVSRFHAMALLQQRQGQHDEALAIWVEIIKGQKNDVHFPGIDFIISALLHAPVDSVWRYADFVLGQDESKGVQIFMRRHEDLVPEREEHVVNFLRQYPTAYLTYLEYLVSERNSKVEFHHTQLAISYLDFIGKEESSTPRRKELRDKFLAFVLKSDLIRPKYLLSRLEGAEGDDLYQEKAIIFGKLGEHDKALRIFVHKLRDFGSAEKYCDQMSAPSNDKMRQKLLQNLLEIFLDPEQEKCEREDHMVPALDLVTRRAHDLNGSEVLAILPETWSLCALYPALLKLIRSSTHKRRMGALQRSLCKSDNVNVKLEHYRWTRSPIYIEETSYCVICQKPFRNSEFARYPNGVIIHIECVKDQNICPITGQIFSIPKQKNFTK